MKRTEIYFDEGRFNYLGGHAKGLADLANRTIAKLKGSKLLYLPVNMVLLDDLLKGGTSTLEALKNELKQQQKAVNVLLQSSTEGTASKLTDEATAIIAEFATVAWRGNERYPVADRVQCIKAVNGSYEFSEDVCRELCSISLASPEDMELWERVNKLKDEINSLETEIWEKSNHHMHLISPGGECRLMDFARERNSLGQEFLLHSVDVRPQDWNM